MVIDAREFEGTSLFIKLKEVLASYCGKDVFIEILLNSLQDAKRVMTFASMSGCKSEIGEKEGYYTVTISGTVCCI